MEALQNDRLRSMPASFLPPVPVNKPGTEVYPSSLSAATFNPGKHTCILRCVCFNNINASLADFLKLLTHFLLFSKFDIVNYFEDAQIFSILFVLFNIMDVRGQKLIKVQ